MHYAAHSATYGESDCEKGCVNLTAPPDQTQETQGSAKQLKHHTKETPDNWPGFFKKAMPLKKACVCACVYVGVDSSRVSDLKSNVRTLIGS